MNITKTLKHNKIRKISLAKQMGLNSTNALKYNIVKLWVKFKAHLYGNISFFCLDNTEAVFSEYLVTFA